MIKRAVAKASLENSAQITLNSIGDAVVTTDVAGNVTYLNAVCETLTGWSLADATGRPLEEVLCLICAVSRLPVANPVMQAMRENKTFLLTEECVLVRRDGVETAIDDSTAPIRDRKGNVTGAVMVFHDASMARSLALKISHQAQHDGLTDLPNRMLLNDRLTQAIALAHRQQQRLAVLFLDLDRFKHINDSLGHATGDQLLQSVAQRLLGCVRQSDSVARQGGDEFVVLLAQITRPEDAALVADKILKSLSLPHQLTEHDIDIAASIGIATYPEDGVDAETLARNADFAMYSVKESGGNKFKFFKSEMNARAVERQSLENGLRHALEHGEFEVHYQPQLDLESGLLVGAEALIRWRHPDRGLVSPAQFLPVAEECGFIVPIGQWVLEHVCCQARAWQQAGLRPIRMAVNISSAELRARGFIAGVHDILASTGFDPGNLDLELTESFLIPHNDNTVTILRALKEMGIQLALDDFGTGYSSLSNLKRFPIDTLKIDQSFVRDIVSDADDASIVKAVIGMARDLNMRVIAEGVETQEQLTYLQNQRCPEGQGYYFSRPVIAETFAEMLLNGIAPADMSVRGAAKNSSTARHSQLRTG